jgi:subtilisin family serine protease/subtilisin-like proprotein convertase family protein
MAESSYFWQGGRKIEIEQDPAAVTIHADNADEARTVAARAGVEITDPASTAPGLVQARVLGDRDESMKRLRANDNIVHHVYHDRQAPDSQYLITETFFIKFKPDTPDHRIQEYMAAEHLVVEQDMGNKTYLVRVTDETGRNPIRTANAAATRTDVEYAEPNLVRQLTRFFTPPDPLFSREWHLHAPADVAPDLVAGAGIFAADAWDLTRGRRDIVICVADDGFDLTHPDFQGTGKVAGRLNATVLDSGGTANIQWDSDVSPRAGNYHGTPCLGVAVAEGNGTGVIGVAPGCSLLALRFPLSMSDAHFIVMFQKISALADVVSCSWGVPPSDTPMSTALSTTIATLAATGGRRGKGLIFCVAAGNNNAPVKDLTNTRTYRYLSGSVLRSYSGPIERWIAAHPNVITVSASTSRKTRSAYSSWGKNICVCAPSDNWDDLGQSTPAGRGITTTDNEGFGARSDFTPGSRFTDVFGGTSSATPTVAGVCALVLSANSSLTGQQVRGLLEQTADKNLSLFTDTPVNEPGDFVNGVSLWFGHGKVNAFEAVKAAAGSIDQGTLVEAEQKPNVNIPDAGAVVSSSIAINQTGRIAELRVFVDITHTWIGDLRVDLVAPDGTAVALHNHTGGSADNLVRTYSPQETPALRPLLGRDIRGTWKLQVRDTVTLDRGRLNRWKIAARVVGVPVSPVPATNRIKAAVRPETKPRAGRPTYSR